MSTRPLLLALHALFLTLRIPAATAYALENGIDIVASEPLPYTRLYCDTEGESHFSDEAMPFTLVDFAPPAPPISISEAMTVESVTIISSPPEWHGDWHPAPRKQIMFVLTGELEVEVSDGEVRRFASGSIVLVEDIACKGHVSRVVGNKRCYMAAVPFEAE